ncbi:hypothetical protein ACFSTC_47430 [Nonomuraea ferruginea]
MPIASTIPSASSDSRSACSRSHSSSGSPFWPSTGTATISDWRTTDSVRPPVLAFAPVFSRASAAHAACRASAPRSGPRGTAVRGPSTTATTTSSGVRVSSHSPCACAAASCGPRVGTAPASSVSSRSRVSRTASAAAYCWNSMYAWAACVLAKSQYRMSGAASDSAASRPAAVWPALASTDSQNTCWPTLKALM